MGTLAISRLAISCSTCHEAVSPTEDGPHILITPMPSAVNILMPASSKSRLLMWAAWALGCSQTGSVEVPSHMRTQPSKLPEKSVCRWALAVPMPVSPA